MPKPAVLAVGLTLAKVLRFEPDDLIEQRTLVIGVVVGCKDVALRHAGDRLSRDYFPDVERWFALAIRFERRDACFAADVILACNRIVACERVNDEAVRCTRIEFDGKAAVTC